MGYKAIKGLGIDMNNSDKILEIAKEGNGYVTTRQVRDANINASALSRLVKQNVLERVSRGYYALKNSFCDDYHKYQSKSKNCIFSHSTALYFYDLSDRTPSILDMTVPTWYNGSLSKDKNVALHYVKKELLDLGVSTITSPFGMPIRVYDVERTICDIIKSKKNMDPEIFTNALKRYSRLEKKDLNKLMDYAKKLKIENKVREYMEVLL